MIALKKIQNCLTRRNTDGLLVSTEINQRYLSGFDYSDGYLLITPSHAYLLTDSRYTEAAKNTVSADWEVICPKGGMTEGIKTLVTKHSIHRLAIEDEAMSCATFQRFSKALDDCTLCTGGSELLATQRRIKTPEEMEIIARAQAITDLAFEHILGFLSPDVTEKDVALELEFFMRSHGAEGTAFNTIAVSGSASSLPHGVPSDVKLREGFLTMDFGTKVDGYCSDMTRTVVIGKADAEMRRVYETVLAAQTAALEQITEGMLCRDADEIARKIIRDAGYGENFGHSLGHGVGLYIHESPSLSARADEKSRLERGNVVTVEPGIYLEGKFGCRIEDMIAIDHDGSVRNFTKSPKNMIVI